MMKKPWRKTILKNEEKNHTDWNKNPKWNKKNLNGIKTQNKIQKPKWHTKKRNDEKKNIEIMKKKKQSRQIDGLK